MATATHGKSGFVYWNGTAVALVNNYKMTIGGAHDDITAMDSGGWRQRIDGIKEATGNVTVRWAGDDAVQLSMQANTIAGTALVLRLYPSGTAGTPGYFSGSAFLTLDVTVDHNAPNEGTYNFESHGPWSYT